MPESARWCSSPKGATPRPSPVSPHTWPSIKGGPSRARTPAFLGNLTLRQGEFCRPHADRPELGAALHRGQLGHRLDRRGSYDELAGPLSNLFDFDNREFGARRLILDPGT